MGSFSRTPPCHPPVPQASLLWDLWGRRGGARRGWEGGSTAIRAFYSASPSSPAERSLSWLVLSDQSPWYLADGPLKDPIANPRTKTVGPFPQPLGRGALIASSRPWRCSSSSKARAGTPHTSARRRVLSTLCRCLVSALAHLDQPPTAPSMSA